MKKTFAFLVMKFILLILSACSGGGNADSPESGTAISPYPSLYVKEESISSLGGVSIRSNGETGALRMLTITGSKDHTSGATTVSDGDYILTDSDGFNDSGDLTDGQSTLSAQTMASNYKYIATFDQSYSSGEVGHTSAGILGIVTKPFDVPASGSATYLGQSEAIIVTAMEGFILSGNSTVKADFSGSGTVKVTMNGFTAKDMTTGTTTLAPIDTISVTDMTISENSFSDGVITTTKDGAVIVLTGANTSAVAEGVFFGYDQTLFAPDEVGGMILVEGEDGIVIGTFVAD